MICRFESEYREALAFAVDGMRYADGSAKIRLLCGQAQCYANMGSRSAAHKALSAAADVRERTDGPDDPGLFGFSAAKQAYYSGSALIWLDDRSDAERAHDESTRAIGLWEAGPAEERALDDEALARVYRATAHLQLHDLEAAAMSLEPILTMPEDRRISWIGKRLSRVDSILASKPFATDPVALELRERIHDL